MFYILSPHSLYSDKLPSNWSHYHYKEIVPPKIPAEMRFLIFSLYSSTLLSWGPVLYFTHSWHFTGHSNPCLKLADTFFDRYKQCLFILNNTRNY